MPSMRRDRRRPSSTTASVSPGFSPRAMANPAETTAPMRSLEADAAAAGQLPWRSTTRFSESGCATEAPTSRPVTGSEESGSSTRTACVTVGCSSATPGRACSRGSTDSGTRRATTKTSAKRPSR